MSAALPSARAAHAPLVHCAHCGLDVPLRQASPETEPSFCCAGCRQAYALLRAWGLDDYYVHLERQDGRGVPARVTGRRFSELDAADLVGHEVTLLPNGRARAALYIEGVHCAACIWLLETLPRALPGLASVRVTLPSGTAEVEWDPAALALSAVARAFDGIGYPPHLARPEALAIARRHEERSLLQKTGVAAACAMNVMFIHLALYAGDGQDMSPRFTEFFRVASLLVSLPVMFYSARPFWISAWAGLRQQVPRIDIPLSLALILAFAYSVGATIMGHGPVYFDSLCGLVALLLAARYLQLQAQRLALERTAVMRHVAFAEFARRLDEDGTSHEVPVAGLVPGERVEVCSGDLVPIDGIIESGQSSVELAVLTGESAAIGVAPGDRVYAGSSNLGARLVVVTESVGPATRLGGLLRLIDEAMQQRPPFVARADAWSRVFVWVVLGCATVLGLVTLALTNGNVGLALTRVVALLVVSCPCALALATPVALTVALGRAARLGIFIKNPNIIELCGDVDTLLLDKTGTLTEGTVRVHSTYGDAAALGLAGALEGESSHPVALALRRALLPPLHAVHVMRAVSERAGLGITGVVDGRTVAVGNARWLASLGTVISIEWQARADALAVAGESPVFIAIEGELRAMCGLKDPLRPEAAALLSTLRGANVRPYILSGDHRDVVASVARELGIASADAHGEMTPEDKRNFVESLRGACPQSRVLMVGDGVNDAAALALADVGVSMHGGAGAAVLAADVVLTQPGLAPLVTLWVGSARVMGVMRRNLAFSLLYNLGASGLAIAGLVGPLLAAVLMPASSLLVILSSVQGRTYFKRPQRRVAPQQHAAEILWRHERKS